jgi:peroxiredoxin Q/BCP|tara:strand:- start:3452 stop:3643 length:192 start_codon:yes stop_codon:yes gene_type:complete
MRTFFLTLICLLASSSVMAAPQVGDAAPDFELLGSDGNTYTLSQFKGETPVVIAFFPKAFTGG